MKVIYGIGFKGNLNLYCGNDALLAANAAEIASGKYPLIADFYEGDHLFEPVTFSVCLPPGRNDHLEVLKANVQTWYKQRGIFGSFGDYMKILEISPTQYQLVSIGVKAFHKPALAADLVIFVSDFTGKTFFVGIERGAEPAKGKLALVGGFSNVTGLSLAAPYQTCIEEAHEEIGLELTPKQSTHRFAMPTDEKYQLSGKYLPKELIVTGSLLGRDFEEKMWYVDTLFTGDEEINQTTGTRRVHLTTVYAVRIRIPLPNLSAEMLQVALSPTDIKEQCKVRVEPINQLTPENFGLPHHAKAYSKALHIRD
jgi:ADP-ribose pyrophosphatase YjhB (NUDIX family)